MKVFGLTGNIGCGKSTVASLFSKYPGVIILDCDSIAKEIISGGAHKQEINSILGADIFLGGKADFEHIAKIIFKKLEKKRLFEALIHPFVWATVKKKVESFKEMQICIVESASIYETKNEDKFTGVILVTCNPKEQLRRLQKNRKMNLEEIRSRIARQLPSPEKKTKAHFVIETDCSLGQLKDRVSELYHKLKKRKEFCHERTKIYA